MKLSKTELLKTGFAIISGIAFEYALGPEEHSVLRALICAITIPAICFAIGMVLHYMVGVRTGTDRTPAQGAIHYGFILAVIFLLRSLHDIFMQ